MTATKKTDIDKALDNLRAARARLAEAAIGDDNTSEDLARKVNQVAAYEAQVAVTVTVENVRNHGETNEVVASVLFDMLANGADDTWSGRVNDVRRAYFDALRAAAQRVVRGF